MRNVRQLTRVPFSKDVLIDGQLMVRSIDISEGGLYVHTGRSDMPGRIVDVEIPCEGETLKVSAKVSRSEEAVGMGLMFVNVDTITKKKIQALVDGIRTGSEGGTKPAADIRKESRVLLIEDNLSTQRIYKSRLVLEGFSVKAVDDGFEAIKVLKSHPADTDAIVLDLFMEKIDGFKVLSMLKDTPELRDIPVIVLSARSSPDIAKKVMEKGAAKYLAKMNTSPSKLAETLNQILHHSTRKAARMNCWEFLDCGRNPGGAKSAEWGVCPASAESRLNGVHGGTNAGRACWALPGTMCKGTVQKTLTQKYRICTECDFFKRVQEEEGKDRLDTIYLLGKLEE
jgi:CheY-like chemotaxis protein